MTARHVTQSIGQLLVLTAALTGGGLLATVAKAHTVQAPVPSDHAAREEAARSVSGAFVKELMAALQQEMAKGGPVQAIKVCREVAPAIANRLSLANGWKVTRVGTRVRNPLLGMPDAWEQQVMADFAKRRAKGEALETMTYSQLVQEPQGKSFRFMRAIGVAPQCVMCHGKPDQIPAPVQAMLKAQYPFDRATGYALGDLRGAISIKQPVAAGVATSAAAP
jgi:hypothetical protein